MKKVATLLVFLVLVGCAQAAPKVKKIVIGFGVPDGHFEQLALVEFKKYVEEKSKGSLSVELHGGNSIGVDAEVLEQIKTGVATMNLPSPAVMANIVPELNLLAIPFLFSSQEMALNIVNGEWGDKLEPAMEKAGYVSLGYAPFGFRHLSSAKRPLDSMEALRGFKLRTLQNKMHIDVFTALGANPTPMPFSELFTALQQGVVDGQENPLANIYTQRVYEALKSITLNGHVFDWVIFVIGKKFYDSCTPEERAILDEAGKIAVDNMAIAIIEQDAQAKKAMEEAGIQFITPNAGFMQAMRDGSQPVADRYGNEISQELYVDLKKRIAEYK